VSPIVLDGSASKWYLIEATKTEANYYTDVSDYYVMLLGTPEAEYKENEKIIDEIWGSFTMRSGGASGGS
jgi:hypothetical protein